MNLTTRLVSRLLLLASLLVIAGCEPQWRVEAARKKHQDAAKRTQALYEEKCRTVAGVKIYRTVPDVEGVLLMKIRPERTDRDLSDLMWPGAALASESRGDGYITNFLAYEISGSPKGEPVTPERRGYLGTQERPGALPGYRYVDVIDEKDGKRYRYTGSMKEVWVEFSILVGGDGKRHKVVNWVLDKTPAPNPSPRYGVTFEDHVIPEERALGIASTTVKVIDLETQEVLGEMTAYARGATKASSANPVPWLSAYKCGSIGIDAHGATRQFVDQVLIPKKEK